MAVHDRTRLTGLLTFLKAGKSDKVVDEVDNLSSKAHFMGAFDR